MPPVFVAPLFFSLSSRLKAPVHHSLLFSSLLIPLSPPSPNHSHIKEMTFTRLGEFEKVEPDLCICLRPCFHKSYVSACVYFSMNLVFFTGPPFSWGTAKGKLRSRARSTNIQCDLKVGVFFSLRGAPKRTQRVFTLWRDVQHRK